MKKQDKRAEIELTEAEMDNLFTEHDLKCKEVLYADNSYETDKKIRK